MKSLVIVGVLFSSSVSFASDWYYECRLSRRAYLKQQVACTEAGYRWFSQEFTSAESAKQQLTLEDLLRGEPVETYTWTFAGYDRNVETVGLCKGWSNRLSPKHKICSQVVPEGGDAKVEIPCNEANLGKFVHTNKRHH